MAYFQYLEWSFLTLNAFRVAKLFEVNALALLYACCCSQVTGSYNMGGKYAVLENLSYALIL